VCITKPSPFGDPQNRLSAVSFSTPPAQFWPERQPLDFGKRRYLQPSSAARFSGCLHDRQNRQHAPKRHPNLMWPRPFFLPPFCNNYPPLLPLLTDFGMHDRGRGAHTSGFSACLRLILRKGEWSAGHLPPRRNHYQFCSSRTLRLHGGNVLMQAPQSGAVI